MSRGVRVEMKERARTLTTKGAGLCMQVRDREQGGIRRYGNGGREWCRTSGSGGLDEADGERREQERMREEWGSQVGEGRPCPSAC